MRQASGCEWGWSDAHLLARTLVSEVAHELEVSAATLHAAALALYAAAAAVLLAGAVARCGKLRVAAEAAGGGGAGLARELETSVEADVRAQQAAELEQRRASLRVTHHCGA